MRPISQSLTNVALIRDYRSRETRLRETRPPAVDGSPEVPVRGLLERWQAPVMSEEEIEAWAARYRLCPKSAMSFLEYLIVRGVGHME